MILHIVCKLAVVLTVKSSTINLYILNKIGYCYEDDALLEKIISGNDWSFTMNHRVNS